MKYLILFLLTLSAPAMAGTLTFEDDACQYLTKHEPMPDVAYQPGVDAEGNDVVPADLNPGVQLDTSFTIPLTVDLASQYGIPMGATTGSEVLVGVITTDGNKAYYNGQPLSSQQEENLAVLCLGRE